MKILGIVGLALCLISGTTWAATVTYTNETTFKAALSSFVTHDFDSFLGLAGVNGTPLDLQIPGLDFDNAIVTLGDSGGTSNSPPNVVLNADVGAGGPIIIHLLTPAFAVGLFNTSLVDRERLDIFGAGNVLLGTMELPETVVNFGGFISDVPIVRAEVVGISPTNGSIYIDDLTIGNPAGAVVPLPSSLALLGVGLLGLLCRRLRLRKNSVSGTC